MIRHLKLIMIGLITILLIAACSSEDTVRSDEDIVVSNDEFLKEFSIGLENRWKYTEENEGEEVSKDILEEAIELELTVIEDFKDLKFEDDTLKEFVISYINELKNGIETLDYFGADSFYEQWSEHYNKRTTLILEVDDAYKIPISQEYSAILNELKATGKEVVQESSKNDELEEFIQNIVFEFDEDESDDYFSIYTAIVENTTNYYIKDFSISLKLIDDGVTVGTEYAHTSNWDKGDKVKLEFMTSEEFEKMEIIKEYIETD